MRDPVSLELGLGLIGIGRPWPSADSGVPSEDVVQALLQDAVAQGIRFFDTAAAYGLSELRLGRFLQRLDAARRNDLVIATKAGERWTPTEGSSVDHSRDGLERSLADSLDVLGQIDVLQVHKCTADVIKQPEVVRWLESVKSERVPRLGASVSTPIDLKAVLSTDLFDYVQFPANVLQRELARTFVAHGPVSAIPILNRPFGSGTLLHPTHPFRYHTNNFSRGVVLTGTTDRAHLTANVAALKGEA